MGYTLQMPDPTEEAAPARWQANTQQTLLPVDLKIAQSQSTPDQFVLESDEEAVGGFIPINADNDNGSDFIEENGVSTGFPETRDFEAGHTPNEDDMVKISISLPTGVQGLQAKLKIGQILESRAEIKLWKDQEKLDAFTLDQYQAADVFPEHLWIEGIKEGDTERELTLILELKIGLLETEADKIKLTVTPVVKNFFTYTDDVPSLISNVIISSASDFWPIRTRVEMVDVNLGGTPEFVQTLSMADGIAANLYSSTGTLLNSWQYDFAPPHNDKTLTDCTQEAYPIYHQIPLPEIPNPYQPNYDETGLRIAEITDRPQVAIQDVVGLADQATEVDHQWNFNSYAVWKFSDGSIYTLSYTVWNIRWNYELDGRAAPGDSYTGSSLPNNAINVGLPWVKTNEMPNVELPRAITALNAPGGEWQ
jgi:hypothetical protein